MHSIGGQAHVQICSDLLQKTVHAAAAAAADLV